MKLANCHYKNNGCVIEIDMANMKLCFYTSLEMVSLLGNSIFVLISVFLYGLILGYLLSETRFSVFSKLSFFFHSAIMLYDGCAPLCTNMIA
jgi:hypothetical protein